MTQLQKVPKTMKERVTEPARQNMKIKIKFSPKRIFAAGTI